MNNYKLARLNDSQGDLSKQWFVYYSYKHPETKKLVRFRKVLSMKLLTKTARYKKSNEIISALNVKLKAGWNPFNDDVKATNIVDAINFVVKVKKSQTNRKRTWYAYDSYARIFISYLKKHNLSSFQIDEFDSTHAWKFMDYIQIKNEINNRTYNNYVKFMRTFFNVLKKRSYVSLNPFDFVDILPQEETSLVVFTKNELKQDNFPLYIITRLIFCCFIRPAEICRLTFRDIDMINQEIIIQSRIAKTHTARRVVIPTYILNDIKDFCNGQSPSNFLFSTSLQVGKKEIAPTRIAEIWRRWADSYGIRKNLYALKHTGNGMAVEAGMNIRDIQLQNGHSSLEMTQKYLDRFNKKPSDKFRDGFPEM
jgi:integrase